MNHILTLRTAATAVKNILTISAAIVVTSACNADDTYTIQRSFAAGEVNNYKVIVKSHINDIGSGAGGFDLTLKLKIKETTKEIRPDGSAQNVFATSEATLTQGGQDLAVPAPPPDVIQIVTKAGKTTSVNFENSDAILAQALASMIRLVIETEDLFFPTSPIKVGDTWKVESSRRSADGKQVTWHGTATASSKETIEGRDAIKIHVIADATGVPNVSPHIEADAIISVKEGRVLQLDGAVLDANPQAKKVGIELHHTPPEGSGKP